jgi:integrase
VRKRLRIQEGSMDLVKTKGGEFWRFRYYDTGTDGVRRRVPMMIGSKKQYPSESAARRHPQVQAVLRKLNSDHPLSESPTLAAVIAEFRAERFPEVRYSTRLSYEAMLRNHIEPKWGNTRLAEVRTRDPQWSPQIRPMAVT